MLEQTGFLKDILMFQVSSNWVKHKSNETLLSNISYAGIIIYIIL